MLGGSPVSSSLSVSGPSLISPVLEVSGVGVGTVFAFASYSSLFLFILECTPCTRLRCQANFRRTPEQSGHLLRSLPAGIL